MKKFVLICCCLSALALPVSARVGDTLAEISKHRGKPAVQPQKNKALWLFEGGEDQIMYSVTFGPDGKSVAEGLKPTRPGGKLHSEIVTDFIKAQLEPFAGSKTLREMKNGEEYSFAGQKFKVADNEYVLLDESAGYLIVWVRGSLPLVTIITPAALR